MQWHELGILPLGVLSLHPDLTLTLFFIYISFLLELYAGSQPAAF